VFLSPRKHINIQKSMEKLDDLQKYVVHWTVFEYYDKGDFPAVKSKTCS
jgi:hypothetical protein